MIKLGFWIQNVKLAARAVTYAAGFICATVILHALGVDLGLAAQKAGQSYNRRNVQVGGAAMSLAGIAILVGVI